MLKATFADFDLDARPGKMLGMDNDVALPMRFDLLYIHIRRISALYKRYEIDATHHVTNPFPPPLMPS